MPERWRDLPLINTDHVYEISTSGYVRNKENKKETARLIPNRDQENVRVVVRINGNGHTLSLPKLMLRTWGKDKLPPKVRIGFKDGDKMNCRLSNLFILNPRKEEERFMPPLSQTFLEAVNVVWKDIIPETQVLLKKVEDEIKRPSTKSYGLRSRFEASI